MALFEKLAKYLWRVGKAGINSISPSQSQPKTTNNFSPKIQRSPVKPGKLFEQARHRLYEQNQISQQTGKQFFTSDFSTNEYLLIREAGCEPISMVMGTSFYKVGFYGYFQGYRNQTGEIEVLTAAQLAVRELALSRMQQEATILGAHGIIGVRLHQRRKSWGLGMIEFTAIGTAIRIPNRPLTSKPFTSDLSGQEFWQLLQAGYYPQGLVFGGCSYYVHSDANTRNLMNLSWRNRLFGQGRRNQELTQFTQGFQDARELAIMRLTEDIRQLGATGAVGIHIEKSQETITYVPWSFSSCLTFLIGGLLILGFFIVFIAGMMNNSALIQAILPFFFLSLVILIFTAIFNSIIRSILGLPTPPFRDLLTNFVVMGTAIIEDEIPSQNPVSKTLIFIPLTPS